MKVAGHQQTHRAGDGGFTLIEILVATALLASMTAIVWGSFSLMIRSKRSGEQMAQRYRQVRLAMTRMSREIAMAFLSKNDKFATDNPRTLFVGEERGRDHDLMFSAFAHLRLKENAKESDQTLIRYFVASSARDRSRLDLVRRESKRLGLERPGEEGPAYAMLEDVLGFEVEYYDAPAEEWRERWNTRSADGQPDRLPSKVRIRLTIKDERGKRVTFRTATRTQLKDPLWYTSASQ